MTAAPGRVSSMARMASMPEMPGMRMSIRTMSGEVARNSARPSSPSLAASVWKPSRASTAASRQRMLSSSSTIRIW